MTKPPDSPEIPPLSEKLERWRKRFEQSSERVAERMRARRNVPRTEGGVPLATFSERVFASAIDTVLSLIVFGPVIAVISKVLHGGRSIQEILMQRPEIAQGNLQAAMLSGEYLFHFMLENLLTFALMGAAVLYLWMLCQATPGKWLLRMRIVDARTGEKPTNRQFVYRYLGYLISTIPLALGFFWVGFDARKQGWHDKIASTLVIKVNHWRLRESAASEPSA